MTQRTPEIQELIDNLIDTMGHETWEILHIGASHRSDCRCSMCLRYWVLVGPEGDEHGEYTFGPFSKEEFLEAGGVIPDTIYRSYR